jgi:hypothetical protein
MAAKQPQRRPGRDPEGARAAARPARRALAGAVRGALALGHRALAGGARGARLLGRRALAAASSQTGRRLGRAAALTLALAIVVVTLYERGEVPSAAAQPAVGAAGAPVARDRGDRARAKDLADHGGLRGRARPARVGERSRPAAAAAAWYAARHGLPAAKVRPLQQDRLSARAVRVLVLADPGHGRLRTALVRVELGPTGWSVR